MLALLKATAPMPESMLFDEKDKTIPSHDDNPFRSFKCASYALKWMDEVNNHYFGETIASHKIHASEYETIYCKHSHPNRQIIQ